MGKIRVPGRIYCGECTIYIRTGHVTDGLKASLARLGSRQSLRAASRRLGSARQDIAAELRDSVLAEIPAFTESGNPDVLPELAAHASAHVDEIIRLLASGKVGDFAFVAEHAAQRAGQRFPLEATLHAFRCGHKLFSHHVRNAILAATPSPSDAQELVTAVADFTIDYTDAISTVATGAYVAQTRLLADVEGDNRVELLKILLDGYDESDGRVRGILNDAGYLDRRQSFCVALAQPVDASEMQNAARARRLVDAVDQVLAGTSARRVVDIRDNKVTAVFSDARRASGWTAPHSTLAKRVAAALELLGNAVIAGVSNDVPSTSGIPNARREAEHALGIASVSNRVVQYAAIPARKLLIHLGGEELRKALPPWADEFLRADARSGGILVDTLRAYADADMNVLKSAARLSVHANTIYARLQRIQDATGLDARSFHALSDLLIIADCGPRHGSSRYG